MADSRTKKLLVGGGLAAAMIIAGVGEGDALAKRNKRRKGKNLTVQRINVANASNVPGNQVIEVVFNADVDPSTMTHAYMRVRAQNATQTGFTKEVFGTFQVSGNVVKFFPRLPTHLRDPDSPTGAFYDEGTLKDNASENAGLQPATNYEIRLLGNDSFSPIRTARGRPLRRTVVTQFSTASASDPSELYTTNTYQDSPPPRFSFSNPPDRVPTVDDQYSDIGGTRDVPNDINVSLFCTKVPLSTTTARIVGNVDLTLTSRKGDPSQRRPVAGSVFVEQNFATTLLVFGPTFPLADLGTYALRVRKSLKDLTEEYDFQSNRQRERLRLMYDWLAQARSSNPGLPPSELPDPPADLIPDWPEDPVERGILKTNMLDLGDTYPDEIDPRVMVLFSTRDEPVSNASFTVNFLKSEDLYDGKLSTAEWDQTIPSAASAIMTIAAGDGSDGDFLPTSNITINTDVFPENTVNYRRFVIPAGVVVSVTGGRPPTLKALEVAIDGELHCNGFDGKDPTGGGSFESTPTVTAGGKGGPGGGVGGASSNKFGSSANKAQGDGKIGLPGYDFDLEVAEPEDGGRGGLGGQVARQTGAYSNSGAGGGGGARLDGQNGASATSSTTTWRGQGGKGGAGSDNEDLQPLVGGAGGGAGGNGAYVSQGWGENAGGGGGGGGALNFQTAGVFTVGTNGTVRANGGEGGTGSKYSAMSSGTGGGGGGGSLLLQSSQGFSLASLGSATDVTGGDGGTQSGGSYGSASPGGKGGDGYVRLESPDGGLSIPGGSTGFFDPVGGGVPSQLYSKFADLGVDEPRILNFSNPLITTDSTGNDAIFVEIQMTSEHPSLFGQADLTAIDANQDSTDVSIMSQWHPLKVHDDTGIPGGVFNIPGYNPGALGNEYTFSTDAELNGFGYRFVRYRITFQLDDTQASSDPLPLVDAIKMNFQFNF